ncbi:MAG: hypothetical protein ACRDNS_02575 [Trebonia sp.]
MAKASADVCIRLPAARQGARRASRVEEEVGAKAGEVPAVAVAGRLITDAVTATHGSPVCPARHRALRHLRTTDAGTWNHDRPHYRCTFLS